MPDKKRRSLFPYLLLALVLALAAYLVYDQSKSGKGLSVVGAAPEFTLEDVDGRTFDSQALAGSVRLMEFIFTNCPDICPATSYNMVLIQDELKKLGLFGDKVKMVAVTFDPERDTPQVLRRYAERMKMDLSGWVLLRGEESQTHDVAKRYGVTVQNLGDGQFVHTVTSLILVDSKQRIRKVYEMGSEMDNARIVEDIRSLVEENR